MGDFVFNVKGLTAADRQQWEKDNLELLKGYGYESWNDNDKNQAFKDAMFKHKFGEREDYSTLSSLSPQQRDSVFSSLDANVAVEDTSDYIDTYNRSAKINSTWKKTFDKNWNNVDSILRRVNPYYNKYAGTENLPISEQDKIDWISGYAADRQSYGEEEALKRLNKKANKALHDNQGGLEMVNDAFAGATSTLAGDLIFTVGAVIGALASPVEQAIDYISGDYEKVYGDKGNFFSNWLNRAIDNPWTNFGKRVIDQGTIFNQQDEWDGVNPYHIFQDPDLEERFDGGLFSAAGLTQAAQQNGFTAASMFMGAAIGKGVNMAANGARYTTMSGKVASTANDLAKLSKRLRLINSVEQGALSMTPSLLGTAEGALNALETKHNALKDFEEQINGYVDALANHEVEQVLADPEKLSKLGYGVDSEEGLGKLKADIIKDITNSQEYQDVVREADWQAQMAMGTDWTINSIINGFVNKGLQSAMYGPRVQEAIKRSKVGKLFTSEKFTMNDAGEVIAKKIGPAAMIGHAAKEVGGEFIEEATQTGSSLASTEMAENNLEYYMQQRFNGVSDENIKYNIRDVLGTVLGGFLKGTVSKEGIQAGLAGAVGSAMGTINTQTIADPINTFKNVKGVGDFVRAIYRNPIVESVYADKEANKSATESAKAMTDWLNKEGNKEKYTTLTGLASWMSDMQKAADEGDEFSYRNSQLGAQVQSYYMLEQLKGTPVYDAYMKRNMEVLNAQEGSEIAKQIEKETGLTLSKAKESIQKYLDINKKIEAASADIEKSLGNSVPQLTKETLVWGKVSGELWEQRANSLEKELKDIVQTSSGLDTELKSYIARHGNTSNVNTEEYDRAISQIEKERVPLAEKISNLKANESLLSSEQKEELKSSEERKKTLDKAKEKLERTKKKEEEKQKSIGEKARKTVLSEADIMSMTPTERYMMLNPKNYNNYSEEQRTVIDNLKNIGVSKYSDFMNKIEDAARIEKARYNNLDLYAKSLNNPSMLSTIEQKLKARKAFNDAKTKWKNIAKLPYNEFSVQMQNMFQKGDLQEIAAASAVLKDNPMFKKYNEDTKKIDDFNKQVKNNKRFEGLNSNDRNVLELTTEFLVRNGVDISDYNAVVESLNSKNAEGKSLLTEYFETINDALGEEAISLDNIGEIITSYKGVIEEYNSNKAVAEKAEAKPETKEVTSNTPKAPSIFETAASADKNDKKFDVPKDDETPTETPTKEEKKRREEESTITTNVNIDDVLRAFEDVANAINEESDVYKDVKQEVLEDIEMLGETEYKTVDDFIVALDKLSSKYNSSGNDAAASLVTRVKYKVKKKRVNSPKENEAKLSTTVETKNTGRIDMAPIFSGVLKERFDKWGVTDFLRNHKFKVFNPKDDRTKVFYVALPDVIEDVKAEMGDKYTNDSMPILAVVLDDNGPIVIGNKKYQVIGALPSNSKDSRAAEIRKLAKNQVGKIISNGNQRLESGILISSPHIGNVSNSKEGDRNFLTLIGEQIGETPSNSVGSKLSTLNKVAKYIDSILDRFDLDINRKGSSKFRVGYFLPNMKKEKGPQKEGKSFFVRQAYFGENISSDGTKTLMEAINSDRPKDLIYFNSRTREIVNSISKLIKAINESNGISVEELAEYKHIGGNIISNIYSNLGYETKITQDGIDLYSGDSKIATIYKRGQQELTEDDAKEILVNLITEDGKFREGSYFQLDLDKFDRSSNSYDREYVRRMLEDNLLMTSVPSLERIISGVSVDVPRAIKGASILPQGIVVNSDNAFTPTEEPKDSKGQPINPDTGIREDGTKATNSVPTAMEEAKKIVETIVTDSKGIKLLDDESGYTDGATTYARVTQVIQADEEGEAFESNSPWVLPSTTVGTGIDELVRTIFGAEGELNIDVTNSTITLSDGTKVETPNMSFSQAISFISKLTILKNSLEGRGLTTVSRDIVATGNIEVRDNGGKTHTIPVAGTLDLLAYDSEGNFYIFDMKTHRGIIDQHKKDKWGRQLSLYKKFLEEKYGIKVVETSIIPIKVDYPAPNNHNTYRKGAGNTILLNGNPIHSNPKLESIIPASKDLNVVWNKLSEREKSLIKDLDDGNPPTTPEERPKERLKGPTTRRGKPKGVVGKPIKVGSPIGIMYSDLTEEQKQALQTKYSDIVLIDDYFNELSEEQKKHELDCLS